MPTIKPLHALPLIAVLSLSACSNEPEDAAGSSALTSSAGLLKYVPSDTPYLLAMAQPLPDDVYDKLEPQADATLQLYPAVIRGIVDSMLAEADPGDDMAALEEAMPILDELDGLMSIEGLRAAGVDRHSTSVIYGAGMLPVIRVTLSDGSLMEEAIARLEASASQAMSVATLGDQEYRFAGNEEVRIVVAIVADELVVSLVPASLSDGHLEQVLGLELPATSIASAGTVQAIADKYDFSEFVVGFFDTERIASTFLDEQSGINAAVLEQAGYDLTAVSAACKADALSIAGVMPRLVVGYTDVSTQELSAKAVLELRPDLAAGVAKLTGPVPGLGDEQGGIFSMGMSTNLQAARDFYAARLDALEAQPYECDDLSEIMAGVAAGRDALNQPVPPIVYGFNGFLAVVEDIEGLDLQQQQPPTSIDMRLLVSIENAEGLLAMGAMFNPEFAALEIEPDGEPVKLEMGQLAAIGQTVHLAMTDSAIAVSVGEGPEDRLAGMLDAGIGEPTPFMTFDMDAERYYQFMGEAMSADPEMQASPELQAAIQATTEAMYENISRMSVAVDFTEHGIEVSSTVDLNQ